MTQFDRNMYGETSDEFKRAVACALREKEKPMIKKSITGVAALVIVLIFAIGIGVAANLDVFREFAKFEGDEYLYLIDQSAKSYSDLSVDVPGEGVYPKATFTVNQAHYDGQNLFIAYTLSAPWIPVNFMDPDDALAEGNDITAEQYRINGMPYFDYSASPQDIELMHQKIAEDGRAYFEVRAQMIEDVAVYCGDTKIDALRCNLQRQEDGTTVGYIEFRFPLPEEAQNKEELRLEFLMHRGATQFYQDEAGCYEKGLDGLPVIKLPVTIRKNAQSGVPLQGTCALEDFTVSATMVASDVDVKVDVVMLPGVKTLDELAATISGGRFGYDLYAGDEKCTLLAGMSVYVGADAVNFKMTFKAPETPADFRLVPSIGLSGTVAEETIHFQKGE